ncbi:RING finger protein 37 [Anabrus simplex]|uniref:RING finger protein 37 n=1 Tax=Anabrus simplex TaxID=316456 RepID=UPI0035A26BBB
MELFNFCHPSLKPVVKCSTICNEGYEVENLISEDLYLRRQGFMTYHSIKPPVDITFEFICHVHISHIIIWPQVGCQKSSGFEILCRNQTDMSGPTTARRNTSSVHRSYFSDDIVKIGSGCVNNKPGIFFCNPRMNSNAFPPKFQLNFLSNKQNLVQHTKTLIIRIFKTEQSTVPAIKAVEIWGKPSKYTSKVVRAQIIELWNSCNTKTFPKISKEEVSSCTSAVSSVDAVDEEDDFQIPEDFIDSITCELMARPVVLPSGKVVDESTLEKHRLAEASWGRLPSDPFTGRLFSSTYKPIVDVALKARLDKFLVENADRKEIKTIPRTVGRRTGSFITSANISSLVNVRREISGDLSSNTSSINGKSVTFNQHIGHSSSVGPKRKLENECSNTNKYHKIELGISSCSNQEALTAHTSSRSESTHENKLDDSLEMALKATLSGLPTFVQFNSKTDHELPPDCCVKCKSCERLYQLPCKHLLCRACVVQKTTAKELFCNSCQDNFRSCDPVKYHL